MKHLDLAPRVLDEVLRVAPLEVCTHSPFAQLVATGRVSGMRMYPQFRRLTKVRNWDDRYTRLEAGDVVIA
jgi:hypothetical protein